MKHSLATLILLLTIGVNALAAQQGKSGHTTARTEATLFDNWEVVEPRVVIERAEQAHSAQTRQPRPELPASMAITDSIPLFPIEEVVWFGMKFGHFDCRPDASSERVYISRKTGNVATYSLHDNNYIVRRATDKEREEQRKAFATMPTDSLFAIETHYFGYVWGCVDNGTVRLYARTPRRDNLLESDLLQYATLGEVICRQYGSFKKFEETLAKWIRQDLLENLFFNRFATAAEAEKFLRANYSFYATAYPDDHAEIVRRFVALLETRLTLTPTERKFLEHNSKEIASVAATLDPTPRLAKFERLLGGTFSQLRLQSVITILRIDGESLHRAEQRYIFDLYEGHFEEPQWCKKAVAIWFIYGVKVPLPRYPTSMLVSAPNDTTPPNPFAKNHAKR